MNILEAFKASNCGKIRRPIGHGGFSYDLGKADQIQLYQIFHEDWEPINEPLTFDRIRKNCVAGETLLVSREEKQRLYLGFDRCGRHLITDQFDSDGCRSWRESQIKDWKIGGKWVPNA